MPHIDPVVKEWLEVIALVATAFGLPVALIIIGLEMRRERIARQQQIYLEPNLQYLEYLKICFQNPELDIYDLITPARKSPLNKKREWIAFNILISIMERAFLLYRDHPDQENAQWRGWIDYIRWWMARPNFKEAWENGVSSQFDSEFVDFVNKLPPYIPDREELSNSWMFSGQPEARPTLLTSPRISTAYKKSFRSYYLIFGLLASVFHWMARRRI